MIVKLWKNGAKVFVERSDLIKVETWIDITKKILWRKFYYEIGNVHALGESILLVEVHGDIFRRDETSSITCNMWQPSMDIISLSPLYRRYWSSPT